MDFKDQIKLLSERVIKLKENTQTEEATKTAFIYVIVGVLYKCLFHNRAELPHYLSLIHI